MEEESSSSVALVPGVPDLEALHTQYEEISLKLREMELRLEQAKEEQRNAVQEPTMDECRQVAEEESELADYALFYTGGEIHSHSPTMTKGSTVHRVYGIPVYLETRRPEILIKREPPTLLPGKCWPFEGHSGYITIKLSEAISVTTVSYEHAKRSLMPEKFVGGAPKLIDIFVGMEPHSMELVGRFRYNYGSDSGLEKFAITNPKQARYVQFAVMDNYGGDYTCLYRIRVHGFPVSADSAHPSNLIM
ncbi:sad1-unc84-like protein [Aphelenchoides avenae]|nr:sad1-unc84-like protein [Aphelenchus avenae]